MNTVYSTLDGAREAVLTKARNTEALVVQLPGELLSLPAEQAIIMTPHWWMITVPDIGTIAPAYRMLVSAGWKFDGVKSHDGFSAAEFRSNGLLITLKVDWLAPEGLEHLLEL